MKTKISASLKLTAVVLFSSLLSTQAKAQCGANFSSTVSSCTVNFTNTTSTASFKKWWYWDCPGGSPSNTITKPDLTTYPVSGTYTVCFYICCLTGIGYEVDSLCKPVTVQCPTGIASTEQVDISLSVTNPVFSSADINYSIPSSGSVELSLFDIVGNKITVLENRNKSAGMHSYTLSTGGFSKGIYFIHLDFEGITITKKIIIAE